MLHCRRCTYEGPCKALFFRQEKIYLCPECYAQSQPAEVVHLKRIKDGPIITNCDVYIGREQRRGGWRLDKSIWHNPYVLTQKEKNDERGRVLADYEAYVRAQPELMAKIPTLAGKKLGCWCKPKSCHGDVLAKLVREWQRSQGLN